MQCGFVAISPASQAGTRRRRLATSSERGKARDATKSHARGQASPVLLRHRHSIPDLTHPPPRPKVSVARCSDNRISAWPLVVDLVPRCAIATPIESQTQTQTRTQTPPDREVRFEDCRFLVQPSRPDPASVASILLSTLGHIEIIGSVNIETSAAA